MSFLHWNGFYARVLEYRERGRGQNYRVDTGRKGDNNISRSHTDFALKKNAEAYAKDWIRQQKQTWREDRKRDKEKDENGKLVWT